MKVLQTGPTPLATIHQINSFQKILRKSVPFRPYDDYEDYARLSGDRASVGQVEGAREAEREGKGPRRAPTWSARGASIPQTS